MKSQTSTEFIILISLVLIVLVFIASFIFDFGSISENFKSDSSRRYWRVSDIGVISNAYNGTHCKIAIVNNMEDLVELRYVYFDDVAVYEDSLPLDASESSVLIFPYNGTLPFEVKTAFEYLDGDSYNSYTFRGAVPLEFVEGVNLN